METEKRNVTFTAFHNIALQVLFSFNAHNNRMVKGKNSNTFSMDSVVSSPLELCSVHPPIISDSGLAHILRFSSVRNKIIITKNIRQNHRRKDASSLNARTHFQQTAFTPCTPPPCSFAYRYTNIKRTADKTANPKG